MSDGPSVAAVLILLAAASAMSGASAAALAVPARAAALSVSLEQGCLCPHGRRVLIGAHFHVCGGCKVARQGPAPWDTVPGHRLRAGGAQPVPVPLHIGVLRIRIFLAKLMLVGSGIFGDVALAGALVATCESDPGQRVVVGRTHPAESRCHSVCSAAGCLLATSWGRASPGLDGRRPQLSGRGGAACLSVAQPGACSCGCTVYLLAPTQGLEVAPRRGAGGGLLHQPCCPHCVDAPRAQRNGQGIPFPWWEDRAIFLFAEKSFVGRRQLQGVFFVCSTLVTELDQRRQAWPLCVRETSLITSHPPIFLYNLGEKDGFGHLILEEC